MDELNFYATEVIEETYRKAERIYGRSFKRPSLTFRQKGCTAGRAEYGDNEIHLNRELFAQNSDSFIKRTIPHECAHLITYALFGDALWRGKKFAHHGTEWESVMVKLGVPVRRCHSYNVATVKKHKAKLQRFKYSCACGTPHNLSQIKHNRIQRGRRYICAKCRGNITLVTNWFQTEILAA